MGSELHCPKCGYELYCGCEHCAHKLPIGLKPYIWTDDDLITCPGCGFTKHVDWWDELTWDVFV